MQDREIIDGLVINSSQKQHFEKALYLQYRYFIEEGTGKYKLSYEDSFSATVMQYYQSLKTSFTKALITTVRRNHTYFRFFLINVLT